MKSEKLTPEQRRRIFHDIQCIPGCANCCPTRCCELDQQTRLCKAHPTLIGEGEAFWRRGQGCHIRPIVAYTYQYFCPPIIKRIQQELQIVIEPEISSSGTVMIKDGKCIMEATREIRGYPSPNKLHRFPQAFLNLFIHSE